MAQPFSCNCSTPSCRGTISGARDMASDQLEGVWLSAHVRALLEEEEQQKQKQQHAGTDAATESHPATNGFVAKNARAAVTSRELSGEMGGWGEFGLTSTVSEESRLRYLPRSYFSVISCLLAESFNTILLVRMLL
jgi:hypothetical protein